MNIDLPSISQQQRFIFQESTKEAIKQLKKNLDAPVISDQLNIDESAYSNTHLLTEAQGWEAPHNEIVHAYIEQFKRNTEHNTDKKVGLYLGFKGTNPDRRIRAYKKGDDKIPYGVWRKLLVATGRAAQEITPVIAFMRDERQG